MASRAPLRGGVDFQAVMPSGPSVVPRHRVPTRHGELPRSRPSGLCRPCWPGLPRATGSLVCAHLLEALASLVVGAAAAAFLPFPDWARWTMVGGFALAAGAIGVAAFLHRKLGRVASPGAKTSFLADALDRPASSRTPEAFSSTWVVRWLGIVLLLHALGVEVGLGAALVYMIVTGLAKTAPILPGNAGIYQGAALAALALVGAAGRGRRGGARRAVLRQRPSTLPRPSGSRALRRRSRVSRAAFSR